VILGDIAEAQAAGARLAKVCELLGVSARTIERWRLDPDGDDDRRGPNRRSGNALTPLEEARVMAVMKKHAGVSPKQLVAKLADENVYVASESTMYRLLRRNSSRKSRSVARGEPRAKKVHEASGPNQVWSWDITWLPTTVRGRFFFLYLVVDVWSRRIVGWEVHDRETAELAAEMVARICVDESVDPKGLVLHSDNGTPMRGNTMLATLQWLGIVPSFSRPYVSDDNPYSEALFRTLKHGPSYPGRFASVDEARAWVARFAAWYNAEHRHSAIRFVSPNDRHFGREKRILARRRDVYARARAKRPDRWSRAARDWTPIGAVVLNPEPVRREVAA
jgi:transposase InsO family protein